MEEKETINGQEFGLKEKPIAEVKKKQINQLDELDAYKKVRNKRKKKALLHALVWAFVIFLMPLFILSLVVITNPREGHNFFGYTLYIVSSDSMKGVFDVDDCVVVKKVKSQDELKVGTDISFIRASDGKIVTHRIIAIEENSLGENVYVTKGVHNLNADQTSVSFSDVIGKRVAVLSVFGHIVMFFRTTAGIIVFLGIFVLIVFLFVWLYRRSNDIRAIGN